MPSTTRGRVAFPMPGGFLRGWTIRISTSLSSCLPLLLRYMFNLFFFFSLPCLSWLLMVENCSRWSLLSVSPLTLHISFGWFMLMDLTVLCPVILMSWAILSLLTLGRWVLSLFSNSFFFFFTLLALNCSPLSKSMRSWYGWQGISSWRWPTIPGNCRALEEQPTQAVEMMMTTTMMVVIRRI